MSFNMSAKIQKIITFDAEKEVEIIVQRNWTFLSSLLQGQLASGVDSLNKRITYKGYANYSEWSVMTRKGLGLQTNFYDLRRTEDLYANLYPVLTGTKLNFVSDVPYFGEVKGSTGGVVFILNDVNMNYFKNKILIPELQKVLNRV